MLNKVYYFPCPFSDCATDLREPHHDTAAVLPQSSDDHPPEHCRRASPRLRAQRGRLPSNTTRVRSQVSNATAAWSRSLPTGASPTTEMIVTSILPERDLNKRNGLKRQKNVSPKIRFRPCI